MALIAAALTILPAAETYDPNTGNSRMAGCAALERATTTGKFPTSPEAILQMGICTGQLNSALFYMHVIMEDHVHDEPKFFLCIPSNVTIGQFAAVVNKFLREHPESRNEDFNGIMTVAAAEAWPCL